MKSKIGKAPKVRFKPGQFFRHKKSGQLYCIRLIYRLIDSPNIWRHHIEERKDLSSPETLMSSLCSSVLGESVNQSFIVYELLRSSIDAFSYMSNQYAYGDSETVDTKTLLNDFELISSGEIETWKPIWPSHAIKR